MITKVKNLTHTVSCKNVEECLEKFHSELIKFDPDIIIGWNVIDFDLAFLKNIFRENKMKISKSRENDKLVGRYKNNRGWPDIIIKKEHSNYEFNWGVLSGSIYKTPDPNRPYLSPLGPFMRTFNVQEKNGSVDSLFTDSLKYKKINEN